MGRVTRTRAVLKIRDGSAVRRTDVVAVEEPLELRFAGEPFVVTMRTPGDDIDLVHGLLHSEGVIGRRDDLIAARYCVGTGPDGLNTYNVLDLALAPTASPPAAERRRQVITSSACGICGSTTIEDVLRESRYAADEQFRIPAELVLAAPDLLRSHQKAFDKTGGLHAAGLIAPDGRVLCAREDVGRHNAVDKVIGWAIRESAPSSLAAELADAAGLVLAGFVRGDGMNLYAHAERVDGTARTSPLVSQP